MISLDIPGLGRYSWDYLALDVNGTLTVDGVLLPGVADRLRQLSAQLRIEFVTADTRGTAASLAEALGVHMTRVQAGEEAQQKRAHVQQLGADKVIAIGNGNNDVLMLEAASLGIAVLGPEGTAVAALTAADIAVREIDDALDLLLDRTRLVCTLRK